MQFRPRRKARAAQAAREVERRALFERLAERPEHVCPFLGLADARVAYHADPDDLNRCYAFGQPEVLSHEQQARVCLDRGYGNCPRYLRGILVIPTEEIAALRRPRQAHPAPPPAPARPPALARPSSRPRRRAGFPRAAAAVLVLVAVLVGGGLAALQFLNSEAVAVNPSPTPTAQPTPAPTAEVTAAPSESVAPSPTPEPTPEPGDRFSHYEVSVEPTKYAIFRVSQSGQITATSSATYSRSSRAPVAPREGSNGLVWWETLEGGNTGWSYIYPDSGDFRIRAVFLSPEGERRVRQLPDEERTVFPSATPSP